MSSMFEHGQDPSINHLEPTVNQRVGIAEGAEDPSQIEPHHIDDSLSVSVSDGLSETTTAESLPIDDVEEQGWIRRNLFKLSGGIFLGGLAVSETLNPSGISVSELLGAWPYAVGVGVTESMWIGGAAMMATSVGVRIGNPLTLKSRWREITQSVSDSKTFRRGLAINTIGAVGTAVVGETAVITTLPPESWGGASIAAGADLAMTVGVRGGVYGIINDRESKTNTQEKRPKPKIREATIDDIDRLADIDLLLFDKAYGTEKPKKKEVVEMLTQRLNNNPGWMLVAEINGVVEGFFSAFRTDKPLSEFESWDASTASGTLDGVVNPNGKYGYITNMTMKHEAVELGAEDMILAKLFSRGIKAGVDYVYFISRMPYFKRWLDEKGIEVDEKNRDALANEYLNLRREDGKRYDPQVRMYEGLGNKMVRLASEAFQDEASLNYGVLYRVPVPPGKRLKKIKPVRMLLGSMLNIASSSPKMLAALTRFK